jgi:signal transduction histidine kinase/phage shock protein PspC (stress-responsive transcriptional regulator)
MPGDRTAPRSEPGVAREPDARSGAGVVRRLYRDPANRIAGGVAAGLAEHLRLPILLVRVVFVALLGANGLGALLYVAYWAALPIQPGPRRAAADGPGGRALQGLALSTVAVGVLALQLQVGAFALDSTLVALVALVALGAGIIWHQADPNRRRSYRPFADSPVDGSRGLFLLRLIGGVVLVAVGIVGIAAFLAPEVSTIGIRTTLTGLVFALVAVTGVAVAFAPMLYRVFGQLREERVARIREQERADVTAMVHDEVLHTLALIQRQASDSSSVVRLARGQERALRTWLYKPSGSPAERFAAALEHVAAEVEDTYGIEVETVVVGDDENDEQVTALVAAAREALVNAARHAKVNSVSLYAEAEPERLSVYVRDRGTGFDLSGVADDRHGVRGSIIGRMSRHGGRAEIRTAPGEGTEVALTMPRQRGRGRPA